MDEHATPDAAVLHGRHHDLQGGSGRKHETVKHSAAEFRAVTSEGAHDSTRPHRQARVLDGSASVGVVPPYSKERTEMVPNRKTLLAQLAPMFGPQIENLAVEALGHILSGSEAARRALSEQLATGGAKVGQVAQVRTQAIGEDGARPDLVGLDEHGEERVLIEAKFWAGLTENQPGGYLSRLEPVQQPTVLLFVAPSQRLDALWAELCRHLSMSSSRVASDPRSDANDLSSIEVGNGTHLMLTSWRSLLGRMAAEASASADSHTETDIRQLRGTRRATRRRGVLAVAAGGTRSPPSEASCRPCGHRPGCDWSRQRDRVDEQGQQDGSHWVDLRYVGEVLAR